MKLFLPIFFILFLTQCNNHPNSEKNSIGNDSLNKNNSGTIINSDHSTSEISMKQSPAGLKIGEYFASDDNEYTFCSNGIVKFDSSPNEIKTGTWKLQNDSLILDYTLFLNKKGIGEPLAHPDVVPGNYTEQFSEYEIFEKKINEQEILFWTEILTFIKEDKAYPYKILEEKVDCNDLKKFR